MGFTALQNINWVPPQTAPDEPFDVIQPVMGYGYGSAKGGGPFWSLASWYVTLSTDVIQSPLLQVQPGDAIRGVMQKSANSSNSWFVNAMDISSAQNTSFTVSRALLEAQPWAYVALEVYNIAECSDFPPKGSTVPFSDLEVQLQHINATVDWVVGRNGQTPAVCGAHINDG